MLAAYSSYRPRRRSARCRRCSRGRLGTALLKAVDAGKFPKADVTVDHARAAIRLGDKEVTALVEKHFGKLAPATAGEKQARIAWLNTALGREKGDAARGKVLFTKHCAACHKLHGEGGKVGPDLTTADRKNRGYLLAQIVDPSGYIRPEYVVQNVLTTDERKLVGHRDRDGRVDRARQRGQRPAGEDGGREEGHRGHRAVGRVADAGEGARHALGAEVADLFAYMMAECAAARPRQRRRRS